MSRRDRRGRPGKDTARHVAYNSAAPADERRDAQTELQKSTMPGSGDLLHAGNLAPMIEFMQRQAEEQHLQKSLSKPGVIPFPSQAIAENRPGMQSVRLDDIQLNAMGDFYEKPAIFSFDSMRAMVDQTPVLSAVIFTRIRQVMRFCRLAHDDKTPGFRIKLKNQNDQPGDAEKDSMQLLGDFFTNCGWASKPRERMKLKRDDFTTFLTKFIRDSLTMDSAPVELEWKRDKSRGIDGMYAVDGATIRLCTEMGYRGDDEIFALQMVQGNIRAAYTIDDLIYVPRNPRSSVLVGGYGLSETELLVRTVTGFLNAFTYNTKFFDSNSIPKGILNMYGNYSDEDRSAFKRYWNAMVKGVDNSWALPVMVSKDAESKAEFTPFGEAVNEIMFAKWMTFLASLICAIYGIAPDEINFESFTSGASSLSGSDTEEKLINSKDKGLRPLLSYIENVFTDYVVADFDDKYCLRFTGLDIEDATQAFERKKLSMTWNEMRAMDDLPKVDGPLGEMPINPSLQGAWQQVNLAPPEDFGGQDGQPGAGGGVDGDPGKIPGAPPDFGAPADGEEEQGQDFGDEGADQTEPADPGTMGKAFGLPIYKLEV